MNDIYGLCLKNDDTIRYVGQTSRGLSTRLTEHKTRAKTGSKLPVSRWIRKHCKNVVITLLESNVEHNIGEIEWIKFFRSTSIKMLNVLEGGQGIPKGYHHSDLTKKRMSKPKSEAAKVRMSLAQLGNKKSLGEKNSHAVLKESDIAVIRDMVARGISLSQVANEYNIQRAAVWKIKERQTWKHVA